jgi:hypothetical protein
VVDAVGGMSLMPLEPEAQRAAAAP